MNYSIGAIENPDGSYSGLVYQNGQAIEIARCNGYKSYREALAAADEYRENTERHEAYMASLSAEDVERIFGPVRFGAGGYVGIMSPPSTGNGGLGSGWSF